MIKFILEGVDNKKTLGFGITEENIKRLKEGKPILVDLTGMGVPNVSITIFYGKDERSIYSDLKKHGLVSFKTKIHVGKL